MPMPSINACAHKQIAKLPAQAKVSEGASDTAPQPLSNSRLLAPCSQCKFAQTLQGSPGPPSLY